jgi:ABC-type antimicrobial peptide transport system permease subunit
VIGDVPYTVIGVLPSRFRLPLAPSLQLGIGPQTDIDVVLNTTVDTTSHGPGAVVARVKANVPIKTAAAELQALHAATIHESRHEHDTSADLKLQVRSLYDQVLTVTFAALVLLLAMMGITGVLSYAVAQRTQEIGVRVALGATDTDVLWMVLSHAAKLILAGLAAGLLGSAVLSRFLRGLLYGVTPTDGWAYGGRLAVAGRGRPDRRLPSGSRGHACGSDRSPTSWMTAATQRP